MLHIFHTLMSHSLAKGSWVIGTYSIADTITVVMMQMPKTQGSVTNHSEHLASFALANFPELKRKHPQEIVWYETYWLKVLAQTRNRQIGSIDYAERYLLFRTFPTGGRRFLDRVEYQDSQLLPSGIWKVRRPEWPRTSSMGQEDLVAQIEQDARGEFDYITPSPSEYDDYWRQGSHSQEMLICNNFARDFPHIQDEAKESRKKWQRLIAEQML